MHGWSYWFRRSNRYERNIYEISEAYYDEFGPGFLAELKMLDDLDYRMAASNLRFAESRANTYGLAVAIRLLESSIAESRSLAVELRALTQAVVRLSEVTES